MNKTEITLVKEKEVKHSIRYKCNSQNPPFTIVYIRKEFLGKNPPKEIKVILE